MNKGELLLFRRANVAICSDLTGMLQSKRLERSGPHVPSSPLHCLPLAVRTGLVAASHTVPR